jgi:glucose/arabinose dehydrogenase
MIKVVFFLVSLAVLNIFFTATIASGIGLHSPSIINQDPVSPPPQVILERILTDLDQPLFVTGAGDGSNRLFIVERPGRIKVLSSSDSSPSLFLDITGEVITGGEQGLLGLAFHPQYKDNRRFFISYSRQPDGATVIAEYQVSESDSNLIEKDEHQLLIIPQPSDIHHGGMIAFGPDGFLYISTGDGNWEDPDGSAQNTEELRGKILRIDVDRQDSENPYSSPSDNPFFGDVAGRDEIYALGFRNPWRFSFDKTTGSLYVGDVGHEQREEINIVTLGGNYGWRVFEGTHCTQFDPLECSSLASIPPLIEYEHTGGRCSVTAGYVYRGAKSSLPSGAYVFADFCTGELFLLNDDSQQLLLDTDLNITSLGEDDEGEIYVVGLSGTVDRIAQVEPQFEPPFKIESVTIRRRASEKILNPIIVKDNGKKYDIVIQGSGFAPNAEVFINGRKMEIKEGISTDEELVARLRNSTLLQPGVLVIEVVNPDGVHSNAFSIRVE